jgi:hypothetical protein
MGALDKMKCIYRPDLGRLRFLPPVEIPNERVIYKIMQEKSDQIKGKDNDISRSTQRSNQK